MNQPKEIKKKISLEDSASEDEVNIDDFSRQLAQLLLDYAVLNVQKKGKQNNHNNGSSDNQELR